MYTEEQAIEAIQALINGDHDNEQLLRLGVLWESTIKNIKEICYNTVYNKRELYPKTQKEQKNDSDN